MTRRKKILLSAFACSPRLGSEPGVGWNWLLELIKSNDVLLITHEFFRKDIESVDSSILDRSGLEIRYFSIKTLGTDPSVYMNSRVYYVLWQFFLRSFVSDVLKNSRVDIIHHLTWGTYRLPVFLGGLGVPFVVGPVGGGELTEMRLCRGLPWKSRFFEFVRDMSIRLSKFDILLSCSLRSADVILCKTNETIEALPRFLQKRARLCREIGSPHVANVSVPSHCSSRSFRLLFAGNLTAMKGVALTIELVHYLKISGVNVVLDIAGQGPLKSYLVRRVHELGLTNHVRFHGMLPRSQLLDLYAECNVFVFPSLHDSSGNVVLEALSRGLPVICLDLGGPKYYLDASAGFIIPGRNKDVQDVIVDIAGAVMKMMADDGLVESLRRGALALSEHHSWRSRVSEAYGIISANVKF